LYSAEINRKQPALLLVLVDQSYSMSEPWGASGQSKAETLALAVNRLLGNAVLQCSKGDNRVHDYFEVGVIGYGADINLSLHGADPARPVLPIGELARNPRRVDQVMKRMSDGAGGIMEVPMNVAVWIDPVTNGPTPMVEAFQTAEKVVSAWCHLHPTSFPPIVINLTDGVSTDGDPSAAAEATRSVGTDDGRTLVFNLHLSALGAAEVVFPSSTSVLVDQHASRLFEMSSELPAQMAEAASGLGYRIAAGARGFLYNAQVTSVIDFLDIGTRAVTPTGLKELGGGSTA
jgi:hypothetical protein